MNPQHIAKLLGGEVVGRNGVVCPGPGHSDRDRSLSVSFLADGAFVVHSHAGDSWQACRDHVTARLNLPEARKRPTAVGTAPDTDATSRALELWRETKPLRGSPAERYLERRRVSYDGAALRWHPFCPFGRDRVGCMVGLVRNIKTNEPQGIHRTALTPAGEKLSGMGSNGRLSLGPTRGGAIKLTGDADVERVLAIGEGLETTLAMRTLPGLDLMPLWAVLSANGIQSFPELAGIEAVWIAADRDRSGTGQRAAHALAQRLYAARIEPVIVTPRAVGSDLNDKVAAHV